MAIVQPSWAKYFRSRLNGKISGQSGINNGGITLFLYSLDFSADKNSFYVGVI